MGTFVGGATLLEPIAARVLNEVSTLDLMDLGIFVGGATLLFSFLPPFS